MVMLRVNIVAVEQPGSRMWPTQLQIAALLKRLWQGWAGTAYEETLTAHSTLSVRVGRPDCGAERQLELWALLHDKLRYASWLKVQLWCPHAAGTRNQKLVACCCGTRQH